VNRVAFITQSASYQGELDLSAPGGGAGVRFLDALNFPHRLVHGGTAAAPSLLLRNAVRRDDSTGVVIQCGPTVSLRPGAIVAAYEVDQAPKSGEARAGAVYEQRRHSQEATRMTIYLDNGFRLEATVGGGLQTLDASKPGRGDFVACLDVLLHDPRKEAARQLSFVAINVRRIEAGALMATG
jgi:hypothetical protein